MDWGNAADWVGIAGSLFAIVVSVVLHRGSVNARRDIEKAQAQSAALAVLPALREASRSFRWVIGQLESGRHPDAVGTDESGDISAMSVLRHRKSLEALLPTMAGLGRCAAPSQAAYRSLLELDEEMSSYLAPDHWHDDPVLVGEKWPDTRALLVATGELIDKALADLVAFVSDDARQAK